jgi:hypothetical protein
MAAVRLRILGESAFSYTTPCAVLLAKLHEAHHRIASLHPAEFKNCLRENAPVQYQYAQPMGLGQPPLGQAQPLPMLGQAQPAENKALDLMASEDAGWGLIAKLGWAHASDRAIQPIEVKKIVTGFAVDELKALVHWLDQFSEKARRACASLKTADKNSMYQLVACGRELYQAMLTIPDVLDFMRHQLQDVDLAAAIATAAK